MTFGIDCFSIKLEIGVVIEDITSSLFLGELPSCPTCNISSTLEEASLVNCFSNAEPDPSFTFLYSGFVFFNPSLKNSIALSIVSLFGL